MVDATDTDDSADQRKSEATYELSNEIKSAHEEAMPELSGTFSDLLSAALGSVNWYEIAGHYVDDIELTVEIDEEATED